MRKIVIIGMRMKIILCLLVLFPGIWSGPCWGETVDAAAGMVINSGTPWVVADGQPEAVQRALQDVGRDWYKVFGRRPVVVNEVPATWKGPVIYLGSTGSWRGKLVKEKFEGTESFLLRVQGMMRAGRHWLRPAPTCAGASMPPTLFLKRSWVSIPGITGWTRSLPREARSGYRQDSTGGSVLRLSNTGAGLLMTRIFFHGLHLIP